MIHRIALTGAQGTGKTTVARAIRDRLMSAGVRGVEYHEGLGVAVAAAGHVTGARADAAAVRRFGEMHLTRERTASGAVQIFDRCLLDALAYAHVLACFDRSEFDAFKSEVAASCARISQVLWLRVTTDYPVVTEQDESPAFRRSIDAAIGELAAAMELRLFEYAIPPDSIDALVEDVSRRRTDR